MELEVEQRERAVKVKEGAKNNWPSRCYPVLYHSIVDEIPSRLQAMVKKFYFLIICQCELRSRLLSLFALRFASSNAIHVSIYSHSLSLIAVSSLCSFIFAIGTWVALAWNVVTVCTMWGETGDGGTDPIWSVVIVLLGCPGAWWVWYRPLYEGARDSSSRRYLLFFCGFIMHLICCLILGIGVPSTLR